MHCSGWIFFNITAVSFTNWLVLEMFICLWITFYFSLSTLTSKSTCAITIFVHEIKNGIFKVLFILNKKVLFLGILRIILSAKIIEIYFFIYLYKCSKLDIKTIPSTVWIVTRYMRTDNILSSIMHQDSLKIPISFPETIIAKLVKLI